MCFFLVKNIQISNHWTHIVRFPFADILVCSVACCSICSISIDLTGLSGRLLVCNRTSFSRISFIGSAYLILHCFWIII